MRILTVLALAVFLSACRGEPVPRDHQNTPSSATAPVDINPGNIEPEPSYGAQGTSAPYETTTLADPPAASDTAGATTTSLPPNAITTAETSTQPTASPSPTP